IGGRKGAEHFTGPWNKVFAHATRPYPQCTPKVHPVNTIMTGKTRVPRPSGTYEVEGDETRGAGKHTLKWRKRIDRERDVIKERKKKEWLAAHPGKQELAKGVKGEIDREAKKEVERNYDGMPWRELQLEHAVSPAWEGHHIHPINWGGDDRVENIIYLPKSQHTLYNTWFEDQKRAIIAVLEDNVHS
ncbi:MAG: hypothetical protein MJE77_38445, partial [Proteobacteria bacterium]|nr:hypothetical protein [Pseudomonadota bacterium]